MKNPKRSNSLQTPSANKQVVSMLTQLSWCMAASSPIKSDLKKLGLDKISAQAAITALSTGAHQLHIDKLHTAYTEWKEMDDKAEKPTHSYIGHYIKAATSFYRSYHVNISVMQNTKTNHVEIIIKPQGERKKNTSYFEGTFKRATKSVKLTLNPEGILTVSPVMAIKAKDAYNPKAVQDVSDALHTNASLPTNSCLFVSGDGKRQDSVRHYQAYKGETVINHIEDKQNKDQQNTVQMALQYMDQVGSQLNALHEQGAAHFDCKLENILYAKNSGKFTVIDIPKENYNPCTPDPPQEPNASPLHFTWGHTTLPIQTLPKQKVQGEAEDKDKKGSGYKEIDDIFHPPDKRRSHAQFLECASSLTALLGHVNDSYAYLRGLYVIADSIPDTQEWSCSRPPP